jgi:TolB-like protein/Flp pilus assembly protein TadD
VEARRLRSKLKAYYDGEGRGDALLIELPKGRYAPRFRARSVTPGAATVSENTIAVLPFANLSAEAENEYFSDGLTEELIHALTKVDGLRVVAWSSAARLKGKPHEVYEIGRQLKVGTVLEGSVRKAGDRLRITAQLINTSNGYYLWSESYDRQISDLFAVQDEIAHAIVNVLRDQLVERPAPPKRKREAANLESYNLYLKGRFFWNKRTEETLRKSIEYFEQAIAVEANCALAYAGLADALSLLGQFGMSRPAEVMPKARSAAITALALDPTLAEAHTSLGLIRSVYDWEWSQAEAHYRRALELNPSYATAHYWYAVDYLVLLGKFEESRIEIRLAQQLDPLSPSVIEGEGYLLLLERRYHEAVAHYHSALELDPYFYRAYTALGRAYTQLGRYEDAIAMYEKGRSLAGDVPNILGALAQTYGLAGNRLAAQAALQELTALAEHRHVSSSCFALTHLGLGEKDQAMDWLERGAGRRENAIAALKVHPAYDGLRAEKRFIVLLRRVGLER